MSMSQRPRRYRYNREISTTVDIIQDREDALREEGDDENARRLAHARSLVADVALGVPPEERQKGGRA